MAHWDLTYTNALRAAATGYILEKQQLHLVCSGPSQQRWSRLHPPHVTLLSQTRWQVPSFPVNTPVVGQCSLHCVVQPRADFVTRGLQRNKLIIRVIKNDIPSLFTQNLQVNIPESPGSRDCAAAGGHLLEPQQCPTHGHR